MSIVKIKKLASDLKEGNLLSKIKTSGIFGYDNPYSSVKELLDLIEQYEEPNPAVDAPPLFRKVIGGSVSITNLNILCFHLL